ncbi:MAG: hypothetical protein CL772_01265 [Chloroflexi bacterium]|nr:hypothetical protein [Chloroflexota bacterium]|tara:strand:- start:62321 stop:63280 length:960 start_codon:yes stop_codon:yes gene_type:complete
MKYLKKNYSMSFQKSDNMKNLIFLQSGKKLNYKESIKTCYEIINRNYENFPIYMFFIKKNLMDDFASIYAFSRGIDFIGDELSKESIFDGLEIWQKELDLAYKNSATNPVFIALQKTIKKYNLPKLPFEKLIKANSIDQTKHNYNSLEELYYYCEHSANPVGEIVLNIMGYRDKNLVNLSNNICTALQITNFIQDIQIDLSKGRTYIPGEFLKKHKVDLSKLNNKKILDNDTYKEQFENLITELVNINKTLYQDGKNLTSYLKKKDATIIQIFISSGESILKKISKNKSNILLKKPKTNSLEKIIIIIKSILKSYLHKN